MQKMQTRIEFCQGGLEISFGLFMLGFLCALPALILGVLPSIAVATVLVLLFTAMITFMVCERILIDMFQRRKNASICTDCGYDMRTTPSRCSECGTIPYELPFLLTHSGMKSSCG